MAGIEDFVEVFRGENVLDKLKNFFVDSGMTAKGKAKIGRYVTTSADYASSYARKFPNIVKSTKITPAALNIGKKLFDKMHFPQGAVGSGGANVGALQIISKKNKDKLKVNILKTIASNAKALSPLALKGLSVAASLPAQIIVMTLAPTQANLDEVNMTLEDFAKLHEGSTNVDKALPSEPKDI